MSAVSQVAAVALGGLPSKELREKFGASGAPVDGSLIADAFCTDMPHDSKEKFGHVTQSWYLRYRDGRRLHVNTYKGGQIGKNVDLTTFTYAGLSEADHAKKLKEKGFVPVPISAVPFVAIPTPVTTETPSEEVSETPVA